MENKHTQQVDFSNPNADKITSGTTNKPLENKPITAIEWLEQEFIALQNYGMNELGLFAKAKEMEKEKLEQFYNHGQWAVIENGHGECFEDYYNRTFKSE